MLCKRPLICNISVLTSFYFSINRLYMAILSKFIDGLLLNGGILAVGLIILFMAKSEYIPRAAGPVSYGAATVGIAGGAAGLAYRFSDRFFGGRQEETEVVDPGHKARMKHFEELRPSLEEYILEQQRLHMELQIAQQRWALIDKMEEQSNLYEAKMVRFEARVAQNPEVLEALRRRTKGRRKHPSDEDNRSRIVGERRRAFEKMRDWTPRGVSLERSSYFN